jgi:acyl-CoA thioester hydrolase
MYRGETKVRVRFYETDKMGYMHHSNYARYYELARTEAMRDIAYSYRQAEEDGTFMPVVKIESKFIKPLFYDDEVRVTTLIKDMPRFGMISFEHEFFNSQNELVHQGTVVLAMINSATNKRENGPAYFMAQLGKHFDKTNLL